MESVLLEFDANLQKDRDIEKIKKDVKLLKRKRQALQERENKVTGDINKGQVAEARTYRLPLSVLSQAQGHRVQVLSQPQVQRLRSVAGLKQRLAASAICTGVTCVREAEESKYMFDPYIGGKPHGPYVLRLKYTSNGPMLQGHSLPHAVPIQALYRKHVTEAGERDQAECVADLLKDTSKHLRGFLSRQQQCRDLQQKFPDDLENLNAANHCTAISFSVKVQEDDTGNMMVKISMLYDKDGERPKPGSLKVKFEPEFDEESTESVRESIHTAFYEIPLCEALSEAFS